MEDDLKKKLKMKTTTNKNLFSIPLKFRRNLSWDWLSSLRFLKLYNTNMHLHFYMRLLNKSNLYLIDTIAYDLEGILTQYKLNQ